MSYATACDRIMALLDTLTWIAQAPADPPGAAVQFPFAALFPEKGASTRMSGVRQDLQTVAVEIHWTYKDLPRQVGDVKDRLDSILNVWQNDITLNGTVDTIVAPITFEFGPLTWGKVQTLGFVFHITFKQRVVLS